MQIIDCPYCHFSFSNVSPLLHWFTVSDYSFVSWNYYYEIYGIDKRFLSIWSLIPQIDKLTIAGCWLLMQIAILHLSWEYGYCDVRPDIVCNYCLTFWYIIYTNWKLTTFLVLWYLKTMLDLVLLCYCHRSVWNFKTTIYNCY